VSLSVRLRRMVLREGDSRTTRKMRVSLSMRLRRMVLREGDSRTARKMRVSLNMRLRRMVLREGDSRTTRKMRVSLSVRLRRMVLREGDSRTTRKMRVSLSMRLRRVVLCYVLLMEEPRARCACYFNDRSHLYQRSRPSPVTALIFQGSTFGFTDFKSLTTTERSNPTADATSVLVIRTTSDV